MSPVRVAISSFFTAEPLAEPMDFLFRLLGWPATVEFAPFGQVFQTLLDPQGLFARTPDAAHIVLARPADVQVIGLADALLACPGTTFVQICAPHSEGLEEQLSARGCTVLSGRELERLYTVLRPLDPKAHALGAIPYTVEYFAALATHLTRAIHRLRASPCKVIALDCDDTLWQGVCGEDGPEGVRLDAARRVLQQFMQTQRANGRLLALASKNNEEDVIDTFRAHPEFPLHLDDFASRQIHWERKAQSLRSIAAELNLGVESVAFLDNDPKEVGEVTAELPGVAAVALPGDAAQFSDFLNHVWAFDTPSTLTAEDLTRAQSYSSETRRAAEARQARSLEEFLAGLALKVSITSIEELQIPRVAQLTQRTNQMNTTTRRRSESDIRTFLSRGSGLAVSVRDRLGDYGLVGVILLTERPLGLVVESFLLSCRALGRGVEHQMLQRVGAIALERSLSLVEVKFESTPRNTPAHDLLSAIAMREDSFLFPAEELAKLKYRPSDARPTRALAATEGEGSVTRAASYQRIAELRRPSDLVAAVNAEKAGRFQKRFAYRAPQTDLERHLSILWSELLGVPNIGATDNFFDLGGHSLLAVQLVSRLHTDLAIDLPLEAVYTGSLTVTELARSIELYKIGPVDSAEYAALLDEVENLSEEEVEALLAAESANQTAG